VGLGGSIPVLLGNTKINNKNSLLQITSTNKGILWFDIAMNIVVRMDMLQRQELGNKLASANARTHHKPTYQLVSNIQDGMKGEFLILHKEEIM
jgi:hypothetical protein